MRRALTACLVVLLAWPGAAAARRHPGVVPPLPPYVPPVYVGECPGAAGGDALGCYSPAAIYVAPASAADGWVLAHEIGHAVDYELLDTGERTRFRTLIHRPHMPWFFADRPGGAGELFADAYANCRRRRDPSHGWRTYYGYAPSAHVHRRVCGFIVRAMLDAGSITAGWADE